MASDEGKADGQVATTAVGMPAIVGASGATPAPPMYLVVFEGAHTRTVELPASGALKIGRGDTADIRIGDSIASRLHAMFECDGVDCRVTDLGSQNGTRVNGQRLDGPRVLAAGDVVQLGTVAVVVQRHGAESRERALIGPAELHRRLFEEVERSGRYDRSFAVLQILIPPELATIGTEETLRMLRRMDLLAREDDGALLAILPEVKVAEATAVANRMLAALAATGARIGLAVCPDHGMEPAALVAAAREAATNGTPGRVALAADVVEIRAIGDSELVIAEPAMRRLYALVDRLAPSAIPVLVTGETGAGKELVAGALHHRSPRKAKPFVTVNCAAIPESLVESELFGHERGAFSGAVASHTGLFEAADGGTVFLDEIGELPLSTQAKLLRILETRRFTRIGDPKERSVDVRVIAATNRDLQAEVTANRFRSDLFFRLSGATLWIPPLRDRPRDLPLLAQRFLDAACARLGRGPMRLQASAMRVLASRPWPGNLRELRNLMEYLAAAVPDDVITGARIDEPSSPAEVESLVAPAEEPATTFRPLDEEIRELETRRIGEALRASGGNQTRAAELIGMPLRTFIMKMKAYGIVAARRKPPRRESGHDD